MRERVGSALAVAPVAGAASGQTLDDFDMSFGAPGSFTFGEFATGLTENTTPITIDVSAFGGAGTARAIRRAPSARTHCLICDNAHRRHRDHAGEPTEMNRC